MAVLLFCLVAFKLMGFYCSQREILERWNVRSKLSIINENVLLMMEKEKA